MHTVETLRAALAERYLIANRIGEGGMATVYLARDVKHDRQVALKVLKPDVGAVIGVERFLAEINVTARLQHPNLLPLFDSGSADGLLFYVMPYVEGESLRARLDRERQLPVDEVVRLVTAVGGAVDYAHRHNVIHRDLKPENILLHDGQPLVADFGIALALSNAGGPRVTQTGLLLGTPQYMSPEQVAGDRAIDGRTDIYSLGALAYELLTGEPPYRANTPQAVVARVLGDRPRSIRLDRPAVPDHIDAAIGRALEKLPADRFSTAKELSEALTSVRPVSLQSGWSPAGATNPSLSARPQTRELAAWALAVAGVVVGAIALRPMPDTASAPSGEFDIQLPDSLQITLQGAVNALALSRDGTVLVFQGQRPGEPRALYLRRLRDQSITKIEGSEGGMRPALSPDGAEVVFTTGALKRAALSGGSARTIADAGVSASWGDAGQIVFVRGSALWMVGESGGMPSRLAAPDSGRGHASFTFPDVLPGGHAALVTIGKGPGTSRDSATLGIVSIPDGKVVDLGVAGTFFRYSPTGHVFYATTENWLFALPFDAQKLRVTGSAVAVMPDIQLGTGGAAAYATTGGGTIAFIRSAATQNGRLVAVSRSGVERELSPARGRYGEPRVSSSGSELLLTIAAGTTGGSPLPNPDVWRFDLTSRLFSRITTDSASSNAVWSADGERIAYVRMRDGIAVLQDADGASPAEAFSPANARVSRIAVDRVHGYLAFSVNIGGRSSDIHVAHVDSLPISRPFLDNPYSEFAPAFSPSGNYLAYTTSKTGTFEVYVRPFTTGGPELKVSANGGQDPVWSRDGREIFYRSGGYMMSATLDTVPRLNIARRDTLFADELGFGTFDVLPTTGEFVLVRRPLVQNSSRPVTLLLNWRPEGRRPPE